MLNSRCLLAVAGIVALLACTPGVDGPPTDAAAPSERFTTLRVGTSGDYAPYSIVLPDGSRSGIDVEIARAFAAHLGRDVEFVPFAWPDLVADLEAARFDVAMSGVTVRPERSIAGVFSVPVDASGAVAIVRDAGPSDLDDLDQAGRRVAVNRGGHLERVARARFPAATIIAVDRNDAVMDAFLSGGLDAAISDTREAPGWQTRAAGLRVLGPFTRDRKAYLLGAARGDLGADLDAWLLEQAARGRLAEIRARYRDPATAEITTPLLAVLAAIDERLALMPWVAEVKRAGGLPIEAPEREVRVLDAAVAAVRAAAARQPAANAQPAPDEAALRALFRAQIEAAKAIQRAVIAKPPADAGPLPDLDAELRPALIRIGDRIAAGVLRVPQGLEAEHVRAATRAALGGGGLDEGHVEAIGDALVALTRPRDRVAEAGQRASPPDAPPHGGGGRPPQ